MTTTVARHPSLRAVLAALAALLLATACLLPAVMAAADNAVPPTPKEAASSAKSMPPALPVGQVLELSAANFTSSIRSDVWMVKFMTPWCPHCKRAAPAYRNFARNTKKIQAKGFHIGKLNCEANEAICDDLEIDGYPTFLVFKNGQVLFEYEGELDSGSLKKFAKEAAKDKFAFTKYLAQQQAAAMPEGHDEL
ncbi:hypothetical protein GGF31_008044 [Allomyces arbusculus]|nr:hypothetical protein GGF31_008044 [Allomyces arbusculus]